MVEIPSVFFIRLGRLLRAESEKYPSVLFAGGGTKEPYYNVRTSIEAYHMGEVE